MNVENRIISYFKSSKFLKKVNINSGTTFDILLERKEGKFQEVQEENLEFGAFDSDIGYEALDESKKAMKRNIFLFKNEVRSLLTFLDIPRRDPRNLAIFQFEVFAFLKDKVFYDNKIEYLDNGELLSMSFDIRYLEELHGSEVSKSKFSFGGRKWKLE